MGGKLTRRSYEELIAGDIEWLMQQPNTLERSHILVILRASADREYGQPVPDNVFNCPGCGAHDWGLHGSPCRHCGHTELGEAPKP
jgi:hypothetical protein